jgi:hypothetical protein
VPVSIRVRDDHTPLPSKPVVGHGRCAALAVVAPHDLGRFLSIRRIFGVGSIHNRIGGGEFGDAVR